MLLRHFPSFSEKKPSPSSFYSNEHKDQHTDKSKSASNADCNYPVWWLNTAARNVGMMAARGRARVNRADILIVTCRRQCVDTFAKAVAIGNIGTGMFLTTRIDWRVIVHHTAAGPCTDGDGTICVVGAHGARCFRKEQRCLIYYAETVITTAQPCTDRCFIRHAGTIVGQRNDPTAMVDTVWIHTANRDTTIRIHIALMHRTTVAWVLTQGTIYRRHRIAR
jgi:hypothetical protein